jgi:hypothetical protein
VTETFTETPLFDMPRQIPPGAIFVLRRTDGVGLGMEEQFDFLIVAGPDDWAPAANYLDGQDETVEFELVMLVPTRIGVRTFRGAA